MVKRRLTAYGTGVALLAALLIPACGKKQVPRGVNLLVNSSFEDMTGGIPRGWQLDNFRGMSNQKAALYGVHDSLAYDGGQAFYFEADPDTRRFFRLSQEVDVGDARRVRVRAAKRTLDVKVYSGQYPQAGIALTFYDENRARFSSERFADVRLGLDLGTTDGWAPRDKIFPVPANTRYVVVHCVLGMSGRVWFDNVTLEIVEGLPWKSRSDGVFTHYWLPEKDYPEGSIEYQRQLHDQYATRLGMPEEARRGISYYFYPDTTALRKALGVKGSIKVYYGAREIHSIDPVDDHEIVHLLTDVYGRLPHILGEGTAYYLQGEINGKPVQPQAQELLLAKKIPALEGMFDPGNLSRLDANMAIIAGASFVGYLIEYGGTERFIGLHRELGTVATKTFAQGFETVYHGSFAEAERVWRLKLASADFSKFQGQQEEKQ